MPPSFWYVRKPCLKTLFLRPWAPNRKKNTQSSNLSRTVLWFFFFCLSCLLCLVFVDFVARVVLFRWGEFGFFLPKMIRTLSPIVEGVFKESICSCLGSLLRVRQLRDFRGLIGVSSKRWGRTVGLVSAMAVQKGGLVWQRTVVMGVGWCRVRGRVNSGRGRVARVSA